MTETFSGSFTEPAPLPRAALDAAQRVLAGGRLHRYSVGAGQGEVALLEREFADLMGARFCLAVASGGYALACALRAAGVGPGAQVLTNAFTLAPVPGAIVAAGAKPVLVGSTRGLTIDFDDLGHKHRDSGASYLLVSHMRGHICDMDWLASFCATRDICLIEDCAHTMGAFWRDTPSGRHGRLACFSTQTYKHVNSGEGGLIIGDDQGAMAKAVLLSGSYALFDRHLAAPAPKEVGRYLAATPNMSGRMDELRAAILRPQLATLGAQINHLDRLYGTLERGLAGVAGLERIDRPPEERFVGSSFQFLLPNHEPRAIARVVDTCARRGVILKWFGAQEPHGYTSRHDHWDYVGASSLPATDRILAALLDVRISPCFSEEDCAIIAGIIGEEVVAANRHEAGADASAPVAGLAG